jgi:DNA-binding NarL/FixJ family response regulator
VCLECGGVYKALLWHVGSAHHLAPEDYREKWGYNRQATFLAPDTEERLRWHAVRRGMGQLTTRERMLTQVLTRAQRRLPRRLQARLNLKDSKTKNSDEDVLALARAGLRAGQIAARLGAAKITVGRHLRALREGGLLPPLGALSPRFTRILELARQGLWQSEIAERLGLNKNNVASALSKLRARGISVPTPQRPRPNNNRKLDDQEFLRLLQEGVMDAEIAWRFGMREKNVISKRSGLRKRGLLPPLDRRPRRPTGS